MKTPCVGGSHWRTGNGHVRKYSTTATAHHGPSPHTPARLLFHAPHARTHQSLHPSNPFIHPPAPSSPQCSYDFIHPHRPPPCVPSPHPRQSSLALGFNIHFEFKATCMSTTPQHTTAGGDPFLPPPPRTIDQELG